MTPEDGLTTLVGADIGPDPSFTPNLAGLDDDNPSEDDDDL